MRFDELRTPGPEAWPLVLFDFGGTLNSDGDHWGALFRTMLLRNFPDHEVERLEAAYISSERRLGAEGLSEEGFDETLRRQIRYQYEDLGADSRLSEAESEAEKFYRTTEERMVEVRRLFEELSGSARLGIVSNFYGNIPAVVREFNLEGYLSLVIDSALVGFRKPDRAIWLHAIEEAGATPERTIVVGDSYRNDILPAAEIGCATVWYRGLEWRPAQTGGAESFQVSGLTELRSAVLSLLAGMA